MSVELKCSYLSVIFNVWHFFPWRLTSKCLCSSEWTRKQVNYLVKIQQDTLFDKQGELGSMIKYSKPKKLFSARNINFTLSSGAF